MRRAGQSEKTILFSYFLGLIGLGTLALSLPLAWTGAERLRLVDAFFTATSAVCVTGLITVDTATYSRIGQIVILLLIQAGGLGIITFSTIYLVRLRGRVSLIGGRAIQAYYLESVEVEPRRIVRNIVIVTLSIELIGALVLYQGFRGSVIERAGFVSVFHSISAFCNAGFSLFSNNLESQVTNPLVNGAVMILVVLGGLGFVVLHDVAATTLVQKKHLSLHTKIVLVMTAAFVGGGALLYFLFEQGRTLAALRVGQKIMAALFQAITPRTAGFNTVPQDALTTPSKTLTLLLMFVGGGSGSIAGGIKINTFFIVLLMALQGPDSRGEVTVFRRKISGTRIFQAVMHMMKALFLLFGSILLLAVTERWFSRHQVDIFSLIFETFSAFGTVGLSLGATPQLTVVGKLVIVVTMFMGRIGLLALAIPRSRPYPVHVLDYPEGEVMIG
jgi:trk system potassium uptake protein TrkH